MNILTHLQSGRSLTPLEALNEFGCFRLAAHIESLRKDGHRIFTHMVNENGKKYAKYTL
jgi:biotin operon repressor